MAACGSKNSTGGQNAAVSQGPLRPSEPNAFGEGRIVNDKITLRALATGTETSTADEIWFYEELEKKTGIHIVREIVAENDWATKISTTFAANDLPDMILTSPIDIENYGVREGYIIPLDQYITPEIMPNYAARLEMNNARASIPASDGKMYYIGKLIAQNVNHDANFFINQSWLTKLGLPVPKTIEELTNTLRRFRDSDPNGNGIRDEFPASFYELKHYINGILPLFASFGVPIQQDASGTGIYCYIDEGNKIAFPGSAPGFRPAVEWLHTLYAEKLMDPESIKQDYGVWMTKVNDGKVGYFTALRLINAGFNDSVVTNFTSLVPPSAGFGVNLPSILEVPTVGAMLTKNNKYPVETLRWIDAQLETKTMMIAYNGPMEVNEFSPEKVDATDGSKLEPTLKINSLGKYEVITVLPDNGLYDYVPVLNAQFFAPGDYYFDIYEMPPHRIERFNYSKEYEATGALENKSYYYLTKLSKMNPSDFEEAQMIYADLDILMTESLSRFITQGVTDASFKTFQDQARNIGVERYLALWQKAYDAYLAAQK
jgi:putative aldouronate transport system substrate-binding protein